MGNGARAAARANIEIRAVADQEELRLVNDMMAKVHRPNYYLSYRWLEGSGAAYPGFRFEHTRVARWRGELAGALRITSDTVQLGEARLRMGGYGYVTTHPDHRHKGVASALMHATAAYLREHGYHVAMLFGIPDYYGRFGFATTLVEYAILLDTPEAGGPAPASCRLRDAKPGDIAALRKMHAANDAATACSLVRTAAHFTNKWERWKDLRVLTNRQGRLMGYYLVQEAEGCLDVIEAGVEESEPEACAALLHACAAAATAKYLPRIRFALPPAHPFAAYLLQFRSTHESKVQRDAGGMMAIVNLGETLESMIPEWEHCLRRSAFHDARAEITLVIDRAPWRVRARRGAIDVAPQSGANKLSLGQIEFLQLLTGYRYLDEVLARQRRILGAEARQFLAALFPKRSPYVWQMDRF